MTSPVLEVRQQFCKHNNSREKDNAMALAEEKSFKQLSKLEKSPVVSFGEGCLHGKPLRRRRVDEKAYYYFA